MRYYVGIRREDGCLVVVLGNGAFHPLIHHVHHSPDGFEWGYAGSGPADLAIAILADAAPDLFNDDEEPPIRSHFYQQFKHDVVSRLPREGWLIDRAGVLAWVQAATAGLKDSQVRAGLVLVQPLPLSAADQLTICPVCQDDQEIACPRDADAACRHCGQSFCAHHILPHLAQAHSLDAEWRGHLKAEAGGER